MEIGEQMEGFLRGEPHAVVGASRDRSKYGNKVLRAYLQAGRPVYPVNPSATEIEGLTAYPDLASLPVPVHGISVITPPDQTEWVLHQAIALGIQHIWLQPGSESRAALEQARIAGINLISVGPCVLIALRFRE